ncbi:uncharacterized protein PFL1_05353 [Pseudozyma flocculosa PF-1]|uniref:Related to peroxisomal membrane protein 4 n=2 Tax=Pseudozyma flocculosa TaxID=84751 RepID=A0A5C3FFM6_9BASI|nr:uncharacterized protein PFL1_05353 [Pseudozyma flocculosa PF-1]EPQ27069.1 hypothetical protein PFL1_05353 [Pseudozyma flocculosa PF-1]SPO42149.1 related to peroxisomal membrane protein 4 [Pseudozyma flocculosa]
MSALEQKLTQLALNPAYHDLFTIIKACRNGLVYGAKIRFPHALVMTFLFGRGTPAQKMQNIIRATRSHAFNLGTFAPAYKFLTILLRRVQEALTGATLKKAPAWHSLLAGGVLGYTVFGERTPVAEQIVLYSASRVLSAMVLPRAEVPANYPPTKPIPTDKRAFALFATVTWGLVMWLHEHRREHLNPGLINSMDYLYTKCERWDSLRNLFWHNE